MVRQADLSGDLTVSGASGGSDFATVYEFNNKRRLPILIHAWSIDPDSTFTDEGSLRVRIAGEQATSQNAVENDGVSIGAGIDQDYGNVLIPVLKVGQSFAIEAKMSDVNDGVIRVGLDYSVIEPSRMAELQSRGVVE